MKFFFYNSEITKSGDLGQVTSHIQSVTNNQSRNTGADSAGFLVPEVLGPFWIVSEVQGAKTRILREPVYDS